MATVLSPSAGLRVSVWTGRRLWHLDPTGAGGDLARPRAVDRPFSRFLFGPALCLPLHSVRRIPSESVLSLIPKNPNWYKDTGAQRGQPACSRPHSNSMAGRARLHLPGRLLSLPPTWGGRAGVSFLALQHPGSRMQAVCEGPPPGWRSGTNAQLPWALRKPRSSP